MLLAEDRLPDHVIARLCGVTRQAMDKWKLHPEFRARVEQNKEALREVVRKQGIALIENRVAALNDRWKRLNQVLEERALAAEMDGVPGGATGTQVRNIKEVKVKWAKDIGGGVTREQTVEIATDTATLAELRAIEKQAAQELGQWAERSEISGPGGAPIALALEQALDQVYGSASTDSPGDTAS